MLIKYKYNKKSARFMLNESNELSTWIYALHRTLLEDGYDADQIMKNAGVDFQQVTSSSPYIAKDVVGPVWKEVEVATNDDAYSLRVIPFISDSYLNALVTIVQACGTVDEALNLLLKYYHLMDGATKIDVDMDKNVRIGVRSRCADRSVPRQAVDIIFALITKHAPILMVDEIQPSTVSFSRAEPSNINAYQRYFSCPLLFGQDQNFLEFPLQLLSQQIPCSNPELSKHLEGFLSNIPSGPSGKSFADEVKREVIHLLSSGTPKLRDIAFRLNISERTLQRKLKKHEICFTTLLNNARLELAKQYLKEPHKSIQETAYQLGFSESGNFIRFFKQQTGQTPHRFVKEVSI